MMSVGEDEQSGFDAALRENEDGNDTAPPIVVAGAVVVLFGM